MGVERQELESLLQDFLDKAVNLSGYEEEQLRDAAIEFAYVTLRFNWPPAVTFENIPFKGGDDEKGFYERGKYFSEEGHQLLRKQDGLRKNMDRLYYENVKRKL